jgi:Peptidase family M1 domain
MRRALLLPALLLFGPPAFADPLPSQSDRIANYEIDVRLDPEKKQIRGRQRLTWRNPSTDDISELWFHLYLNAFRNSRSTFFKESGGQLRGVEMPTDGWGWIDVTSMRIADGTDLTKAIAFAQPDDGNPDDRTVIRVPLPQPVPPGGTVILDITFEARLPRVFARTGYRGDFFLVGQWFPKIGVYEPAGMRGRAAGGWNCHQFHANSEFYADFGTYGVDITVPTRFIVGATGERKSARRNPDGTTTYRYEQADVHDFAWTADPTFVEVTDRFSATTDVTLAEYAAAARLVDRAPDEVRLSDVEIRLLIHRERLPQKARHIQAAKLGLKYFGLWYGAYPYKTLTVVDPAFGAGGAAGMEYPTFITAGTSWLLNRWPFDRVLAVEGVTVHEFGHQFWYGLVANNEFEEAWLDEGINSYSTGKIMDLAFGPSTSAGEILGLRIGNTDTLRAQNSPNRQFDAVRTPSWQFMNGYGYYVYTKPELILRTLEGFLGEQTMARVMRTYHERWRFRHPGSDDFYAVASEVAGRDLTWYFKAVVERPDILDYELSGVRSGVVSPVEGWVDEKGQRRLLTTDQSGDPDPEKGPFESVVTVRRRGGVTMPVEIELQFEGKAPERITWDGDGRWKRFTFVRPERLRSARLDPYDKRFLDVDWLNNARRIESDPRVAAHWTARWLFWVQNLVAMVGL